MTTQGIETRQGGNGAAGAVHESPVGGNADAPNPRSIGGQDQAVEAVARALLGVEESWHDHDWEQLPECVQTEFRKQATAAIAAIPTPPPASLTDLIEKLWPKLRAYVKPPPFYENEDGWRTIVRMLLADAPPPASNRDHAELIERLENAVLDALDPLPVASPLAVDLRGILKLVAALQALTTQHDNTDLIADLEARDADWQENCNRWMTAASDLGQPMDAETEAKCRLTIYRRAADALQAMTDKA